jgi:hypothetical protein
MRKVIGEVLTSAILVVAVTVFLLLVSTGYPLDPPNEGLVGEGRILTPHGN